MCQGVSTRKVKEITEMLCGVDISTLQVSRTFFQLDGILQEWRERSLGEICYLFLGARYEKLHEISQILEAVLVGTRITPEGQR